jgi:hypothetical protein
MPAAKLGKDAFEEVTTEPSADERWVGVWAWPGGGCSTPLLGRETGDAHVSVLGTDWHWLYSDCTGGCTDCNRGCV